MPSPYEDPRDVFGLGRGSNKDDKAKVGLQGCTASFLSFSHNSNLMDMSHIICGSCHSIII